MIHPAIRKRFFSRRHPVFRFPPFMLIVTLLVSIPGAISVTGPVAAQTTRFMRGEGS